HEAQQQREDLERQAPPERRFPRHRLYHLVLGYVILRLHDLSCGGADLRSTSLPWDGRRWPALSAGVGSSHPLRYAQRVRPPGCSSRPCSSPYPRATSGGTTHVTPLRRRDARDGHGPFHWTLPAPWTRTTTSRTT